MFSGIIAIVIVSYSTVVVKEMAGIATIMRACIKRTSRPGAHIKFSYCQQLYRSMTSDLSGRRKFERIDSVTTEIIAERERHMQKVSSFVALSPADAMKEVIIHFFFNYLMNIGS